MANITLKGSPFRTVGELPAVGTTAPDCSLLKDDLSEIKLSEIPGKKVLNIFPSIDTPVCATSVRTFNEKASDGATVLNISADLPFAQKRFCGAEGIENVQTLSTFRSAFLDDFGTKIVDGPLAGLSARAVVVIDENNKVLHCELVTEVADEPNYDAALTALKG
jgi:thiol peroxidase